MKTPPANLMLAGTALLLSLPTLPAVAGPDGSTVARGSASIARDGAVTTITASDGAILNHQSFHIAPHEAVRFLQPHAGARVLNRVVGPDASLIEGSLFANGRVYLVNPNGIFMGPDAIVRTSAFIAAGAHMADADFLAGLDRFTDARGAVVNQGLIEAGEVMLFGRTVANLGTINAPNGTVALLAGENLYLKPGDGGPLVQLDASGPPERPAVHAGPTLAAGDIYSMAVWQGGRTTARAVRAQSADVRPVVNTGDIRAQSDDGRGGEILLAGPAVRVWDGTLDASGPMGGGTVQIGARPNGAAPLSATVHTEAGVTVRADATGRGDAGSIELWSSHLTLAAGELSARGGPLGGDGGFIETSSMGGLLADAGVDIGASNGRAGLYLIDPVDVLITTRALALSKLGQLTNPTGEPVLSLVLVNRVTQALLTGNVEINTEFSRGAGNGTITVDVEDPDRFGAEAVSYALPGPRTLTLRAHRDIRILSPLAPDGTSAPLNLVLAANSTFPNDPDPDPATGDVRLSAPIRLSGGGLTSSGVNFNGTLGLITAGWVDLQHSGTVTLGSDVTLTGIGPGGNALRATGTSFTLNANVPLTTSAGGGISLSFSDTVTIGNGGLLDLGNAFSITGAQSVSLGRDVRTTGDPITIEGAVTLTGGDRLLRSNFNTLGAPIALGAIERAATDPGGLTVRSGNGAIVLGDAGQANPLAFMTVEGASVSVGSARTTGPQTYTVQNAQLRGGTLETASANLAIFGASRLQGSTTLRTSGGPGGGAVTLGSVDSDGAGSRAFTIDAGSAPVGLTGDIGGLAAPQSLTINAGPISAASLVTLGPQSITATETTLRGGIVASLVGGSITFIGQVRLNNGVTAFTAGNAGDDLNFVGPIVAPGVGLALNAGQAGTVTFLSGAGLVGGELGRLDVSLAGLTQLAGDIRTLGGVRIGSPLRIVGGSSIVDARGGTTVIAGDVTGAAGLAPTLTFAWEGTAGVQVIGSTSLLRTPLTILGNVGSTGGDSETFALGSVIFGSDTPGGAIPTTASVVFSSVEPGANGLYDAGAIDLGRAYTIRALDAITFGASRKLLVFGSAELRAGAPGRSGAMLLGDVTTFGDLALRSLGPAGTMAFRSRPPGFVESPATEIDRLAGGGGVLTPDTGVDVVSGGNLTWEITSGTGAPTQGGGPVVVLVAANPGLSPAGNVLSFASPMSTALFAGQGPATTGRLFSYDLSAAAIGASGGGPGSNGGGTGGNGGSGGGTPGGGTPDTGVTTTVDPAEARALLESEGVFTELASPTRVLSDADALASLGIILIDDATAGRGAATGGAIVLVDQAPFGGVDPEEPYRVSSRRVSRTAATAAAERFREVVAGTGDLQSLANALAALGLTDGERALALDRAGRALGG